jgi:hypothetical protein
MEVASAICAGGVGEFLAGTQLILSKCYQAQHRKDGDVPSPQTLSDCSPLMRVKQNLTYDKGCSNSKLHC